MNPTPTSPPLLPHERALRVGLALALLLALVVLASLQPRGQKFLPGLPCGFHAMTGLPCPLCGGTRAAHAILRGDFPRANSLNPLAYLALAAVVALASVLLIEAARQRRITDWEALIRRQLRWAPVAILLLVAWWIPHILLALRSTNTDLVDLRNPIAAKLKSAIDRP